MRTIGLEGKRERAPASSIKRSKYKDFLSSFEAVGRGEITAADCEEEVREVTDGYADRASSRNFGRDSKDWNLEQEVSLLALPRGLQESRFTTRYRQSFTSREKFVKL